MYKQLISVVLYDGDDRPGYCFPDKQQLNYEKIFTNTKQLASANLRRRSLFESEFACKNSNK